MRRNHIIGVLSLFGLLVVIQSIMALSSTHWMATSGTTVDIHAGLWKMCFQSRCVDMPTGSDCSNNPANLPCDSGGMTCSQCTKLNVARAAAVLGFSPAILATLAFVGVSIAASRPQSTWNLFRWKKLSIWGGVTAGFLWIFSVVMHTSFVTDLNSDMPSGAAYSSDWGSSVAVVCGFFCFVIAIFASRLRPVEPEVDAGLLNEGGGGSVEGYLPPQNAPLLNQMYSDSNVYVVAPGAPVHPSHLPPPQQQHQQHAAPMYAHQQQGAAPVHYAHHVGMPAYPPAPMGDVPQYGEGQNSWNYPAPSTQEGH